MTSSAKRRSASGSGCGGSAEDCGLRILGNIEENADMVVVDAGYDEDEIITQ